MNIIDIGGRGDVMADRVRAATALAVEKLTKGNGRSEMEEAREAEELCYLGEVDL